MNPSNVAQLYAVLVRHQMVKQANAAAKAGVLEKLLAAAKHPYTIASGIGAAGGAAGGALGGDEDNALVNALLGAALGAGAGAGSKYLYGLAAPHVSNFVAQNAAQQGALGAIARALQKAQGGLGEHGIKALLGLGLGGVGAGAGFGGAAGLEALS